MAELLTCTRILYVMVFLGFFTHHMVRVNISIAIVEMIKTNNNSSETNESQFLWSQEGKNNILGSFYWGYIITQIPAGRLAEIFGTRIVMGIGSLLASLATIFTPFAAFFNYHCLLVARFCLGLALGVQWPSIFPLTTRWIPKAHTSTFLSQTISSSLGAAFTLPVCGYLISYFGWPSVFYVTGCLSLMWTLAWFYLVYDSPKHHPRISQEEKEILEREVITDDFSRNDKIPWKDILTSGPVWAIVVGSTMQVYPFFVILNHIPTYMNDVLHFNIKQNGWLSSFPFYGRYSSAVLCSYLADNLIKTEKFSVITVRKVAVFGLFTGPFFFMCVQAIWGYDCDISIIDFVGSMIFMGLVPPSFFANAVDIAPSYSGTLVGLIQVFICFAGYTSTQLVTLFTAEKQTFAQWSNVFLVLAGINLFGLIFYFIFGSAEVQSWNFDENRTSEGQRLEESA